MLKAVRDRVSEGLKLTHSHSAHETTGEHRMMAFFLCVYVPVHVYECVHQRSTLVVTHSSHAVHLVPEEHRKGRGCFTDFLLTASWNE